MSILANQICELGGSQSLIVRHGHYNKLQVLLYHTTTIELDLVCTRLDGFSMPGHINLSTLTPISLEYYFSIEFSQWNSMVLC